MKLLIASVAAIALSASPALALAQTAPPEHGTTTTTHVEETTHPTQHHTTSMHHHTTVEHHHTVHCGCPGHHYQAHHKTTTISTTKG